MRSRCARQALALAMLAAGAAAPAAAQAIPRPDYVAYLPRYPLRAVGQTDASARLHLFGDERDPRYRDLAPRNGIDDRRDTLLAALGRQFAPWMVRNTYGFPTDLGRLIRERDVPLVIDRFDLARQKPVALASDTLHLGRPPAARCTTPDAGNADCRLEALLRRLGPQASLVLDPVAAESDPRDVLYLDVPGEDPKSWAAEYGDKGGAEVAPRYLGYAKAYVHPFLANVTADTAGGRRYELVLQYWFYYPTNDAGNVHEGDFEHINVVVAPRSTVGEPMDSALVSSLLDGTRPAADLVIARIEYYFHSWFFTLDYARPNVYLPRDAWQRAVDSLPTTHEGERAIRAQIRRRAYLDDAETQVNRHPLVMIGGDGRGLNLLLRPPGSLGRSSHGSFPFNGLYKKVGPAGTGESIDRPTDLHRRPPAADAPESELVVRYDNPDRLELLPDWERIAPLALAESPARWDWAWFLLPVHVGYPATESPLAGVVSYANTGNLPPGSPPYNGGWNRTGAGAGYAPYVPHRVNGVFATDVQDTYSARWGYLNATVPTLSFLPPFDLLLRVVGRPIARLAGHDVPTYARSEDLPPRWIGAGGGVSWFTPSSDFALLAGFPEIATPLIQRANQVTGTPLQGYGLGPATFDPLVAWRAEVSLHLGRHFVTTNALGHGRSTMHQEVVFSDYPPEPITASLDFWEYTGTLRWNLATRRWQPFVNAGYGLSWYRLENYTAFGDDLGDTRWVRKPGFFDNLLPNTWHVGGGLEVLPRYGFGRINLGVKASANLHLHSLGLSTGDATTVFFQNTTVERWVFNVVGTVSY
jgi:hypothetical protein